MLRYSAWNSRWTRIRAWPTTGTRRWGTWWFLIHLAAGINDGDTDTALGLIRLVGVEHLLRAARPGPTTPLGVHTRLTEQVRSDLVSDYFCNPDIGWIVEQRSDNSAHET